MRFGFALNELMDCELHNISMIRIKPNLKSPLEFRISAKFGDLAEY